jgi:thiosulfate/3-mercaptopyruvate sulfurtransferase
LPAQSDPPQVVPGDFRADFASRWLAEAEQPEWTRESANVQIIDARSRDEYTGRRALGGRGGRIPGAIHLDWLEVLDGQGRFKEVSALRELLASRGVSPRQRQVVYCHSGVRSSVVTFALRRVGYHNVSNFYGGWRQWSATDLPAETGEGVQEASLP